MNILCIGNSFTQDPLRYLNRVADAQGVNIQTSNLHIGGCPLVDHFNNLISGAPNYAFEYNGHVTGINVSLQQAIAAKDYDVITLQQCSYHSFIEDTYHPYIDELVAYIRRVRPKAKIFLQFTWAYEEGSDRLTKELSFAKQEDMYNAIVTCMSKIAKEMKVDGVIPSGLAMQKLSAKNVGSPYRDTFHANLGFGRLCLAYTWLYALSGISPVGNTFRNLDIECSERQIIAARDAAIEACEEYLSIK